MIRQGRVELATSRRLGRRLVVELMHEGDVEGDIGLILGKPPPYTARALDEVVALRISGADFEELLANRLAIARRWLTSVAGRVVHAQQRILQLGTRDLAGQAAALLLDGAHDGVVELSQEALAALLGVHRQSLNAVLRDMERAGSVRLSYRRIELVDGEELERRAGRS